MSNKLKFIKTKDIQYKGQLFRGRKIIGTEETLKLIYPLIDKVIFISGWRSKDEQAQMVKKGASKTMDSNHRRGVAYDVWNWSESESALRKIGFINDINWDKGHFPFGGENKARKHPIIDKLPKDLKEYKPKIKPVEPSDTTQEPKTPVIEEFNPLKGLYNELKEEKPVFNKHYYTEPKMQLNQLWEDVKSLIINFLKK